MKSNILKSILATILLLLGVSQTTWGETIYFKNTLGWSDVYVYLYNSSYWSDSKGSGSNGIASGPNKMTKVDGTTDVYSYTFTGSYTIKAVAFTKDKQSNYENFWQTEAVYREDFSPSIPMYTPETTKSGTCNTNVPYYNAGTWSAYPSSGGGGTTPATVQLRGITNWDPGDEMAPAADGLTASVTLSLSANSTYKFKIYYPNSNTWYGNSGTMNSDNCTGWTFSSSSGDAGILTSTAGNYTFTWTYSTKKLSVTYPSSSTTYTVTFNANGHGKAPTAQSVTSGGKATAPEEPTATGYTFGGWYTEAACTTAYNFNTEITKNITLYAKWTENKYSVTISAGEGGSVSPSGAQQVGSTAKSIKATPKAGYEFDGWETTGDVTIASATSATTSITAIGEGTVTAKFKYTASSITYYFMGQITGWGDEKGRAMSSTEEYAYIQLTDNASGTVFKVYNANLNNDAAEYLVGCDTTLFAGSGMEDTYKGNIAITAESYYHNIQMPSDAPATCFVILYYPNTTINPSNKYVVTASTTLPDASTYTVFFNYNGGSGATTSLSCDKGENITLPTPDARTGYTFKGWYTAATDGTLAGAAGATYTPTADITLYAQWLKDYSADTYYYFDDKITKWEGAVGVEMVNAAEYALIQRPAYNNTNNKFKIFPTNPKDDDNLIANSNNIATGTLAGAIDLSDANDNYKNIKIEATTSDYFVILYYPNTTTNPSNKFLVAASYSLPDAESYNISFGVVGETGGKLTAKSGNSTISYGERVSFATFTATPAAGYSVEGWYSDYEGTQRITRAGTNTTYSQLITEANNSVYVKFVKLYAIYYKFNDQTWNDDYYAYIFTDEVWHSENGVQPKVNRSEYGKMTKYNDSVYYYKFTKSADYPRFAFSWGDHSDADCFNNIDAVYRSDFHKDMPVFIAERGQSKSDTKAHYYNKGVWMKFNDTDPGYNLGLYTNGTWDHNTYRFTADNAGDYVSTVNVVLNAGQEYSFWVKNDKNYYFKTSKATCSAENYQFTFYEYDMGGDSITIVPTITGTYTFQLNLANGKVEIDVLYPSTAYRLVYVEKEKDKDNSSNLVKFHPSHQIRGSETTRQDTISMYVKPFERKNSGENPNTCEIWLQELAPSNGNEMVWVTRQVIDIKSQSTLFTTNGVYNFVLVQDHDHETPTTSLPTELIHPYSGDYYIRLNLDKNYKASDKTFRFSDYASKYDDRFDYYFCKWIEKSNISFLVACDYSACVTDTLYQEPEGDPHRAYTDANGKLLYNANVRFMWNSENNSIDRAYIAGGGGNVHLMSKSGIYDTDRQPQTEIKLLDAQNWVYQTDVYAKPNVRVKLWVKTHDVEEGQKSDYLYFKGAEGEGENDFSEGNTVQLIGGTESSDSLKVRVLYDFKSNHLICAWLPEGNITGEVPLKSDLILIRKEHEDAQQITFQGENAKITKVSQAYGVLNLTYNHMFSNSISKNAKQFYWISFPFDVHLSEVFSSLVYGKDYIIRYYDGEDRAKTGNWADSPTFWKMYTTTDGITLEKGKGYLLNINYSNINNFFKINGTDTSIVSIYFPSNNTDSMTISGEIETVFVPAHECTIQRDHRYIYDSNWNLIGVPSWADIKDMGIPGAKEIEEGISVKFLYDYDPGKNVYNTVEATDTTFHSMKAYMVQFAGTINWKDKEIKEIPPSEKPLRAPAALTEKTVRLELLRGEEALDHTFVQLSEADGITEGFDLNNDLTKIQNSGCNLFSLIGSEQIEAAANILPYSEQTVYVPLGVIVDRDGAYTFALPKEMEGMDVRIADAETGYSHNLLLSPYEVALTAGTYTQRFSLEIHAASDVTTGCQETDAAGNTLRKVLINGQLYILRDGKAYDAIGREL